MESTPIATGDESNYFAQTAVSQEEPRAKSPVKHKIRIEDLYITPKDEHESTKLSKPVFDMQEEIKNLYLHEYGKGMDQFLETTWYTEHGLNHLMQDDNMCQKFGGMLELFSNTMANDYENFLKIPQTEARIIWMLLCLPRTVSTQAEVDGSQLNEAASDPTLVEVLRRLSIFENLITKETLSENPLGAKATNDDDSEPTVDRQREFWSELGRFVSLSVSDHSASESCLEKLRQLLDQRENRDVLYSMAIVRCLAPTISNSTGQTNGHAFNGEERLIVAKKFIEDEASSKGTTQVVQRLCGMAARSWATLR